MSHLEAFTSLVWVLVFKTMVGLNKVPGGFDSHPSPPICKLLFSLAFDYLGISALESNSPGVIMGPIDANDLCAGVAQSPRKGRGEL